MPPFISTNYVPASGPITSKLWFVGEAPGESEDIALKPFVGASGDILNGILLRYGLSRDDVYVTNLCPYRPFANKFENCLGTPELAAGVDKIKHDLKLHKPNVVVALGRWAFQVLSGKAKASISSWRGSIVSTREGVSGTDIKLIGSYHPASVLRDGTQYPVLDWDIRRAVSESRVPTFDIPRRNFVIDPRGVELELIVEELSNADSISVDIETTMGAGHLLCVGFAADPMRPICIVNHNDPQINSAIQRILDSPAKKIFHFGTFDTTVLRLMGFTINNYWWDTLIGQHVLFPELPRSLDFLTSIYTKEPYYKASGRAELPKDQKAWSSRTNRDALYIYNCRDAAVTLEIQREQDKEFSDNDRRVFEFEMAELEMAQHISEAGLLVDFETRDKLSYSLYYEWALYQKALDMLVGMEVNVSSPKLKKILYDDLGLPKRYKKGPKGNTVLAVDEDAIVANISHCKTHINKLVRAGAIAQWEHKLTILKLILKIRGVRKLLSTYVDIKFSPDGRARGLYKVANTETGRWAAEKFIDDTGTNPQTIPRLTLDLVAIDPQIQLPTLTADDDDDETGDAEEET
jgi:uracil-DNA glycosylase family 4